MRLSLTVFGVDPTTYADIATSCDAAGVEILWLSDHLLTPAAFAAEYPYSDSGRPGYDTSTTLSDVWVTIGNLAARTTRLRFSPGVLILPLRSPFVTALALATASRLSGGRVMLGVGSGWMREEFDSVGEDFDTRGPRLDECLDVIAGLLTGAEFEYHGDHFDFGPAAIGGEPVPRVPIVFGGSSRVALRRLARRGDAWFGPSVGLEESLATVLELDRLRAEGPRAGEPITHYVRMLGPLTRDTMEAYREAGFEHVVVSGGPLLKGMTSAQQREEIVGDLVQLAGEVG